jgi:hypothetical protein
MTAFYHKEDETRAETERELKRNQKQKQNKQRKYPGIAFNKEKAGFVERILADDHLTRACSTSKVDCA